MYSLIRFMLCCWVLFVPKLYAADVSTTFPTDQTSGTFTLGTQPKTVTFSGGEVRIAGISSLYRSGSRAFMVRNTTATISFGTPAVELLFYIRGQSTGNAFVRLLDADDNELLRVEANSSDWSQVSLRRDNGIAKVEFTNNASDLAAMEDFEYTAMAEQSTEPTPITDPIPAMIEEGALKANLIPLVSGTLTSPVTGATINGQDNFVYIVDQVGILYGLNLSNNQLSQVLTVTDRLVEINPNFDERGFLGVAFHPNFNSNGLLYTYTSEPAAGSVDFSFSGSVDHHTVINRWQATLDPDMGVNINSDSATEIMRIAQPQSNHNGGTLIFDGENMLLISLGDGGAADDQGNGHSDGGNGQDTQTPLGKLLRIDPLGNNAENGKYGIPANNPFIDSNDVLDEIWVIGVRNPYRIVAHNDQVYVCDVGQNKIEEVTLVTGGENLGWSLKEGSFAFDNNGSDSGFVYDPNLASLPSELVDPNWQYDRDEGVAVICGAVYEGNIEVLKGKFLFGDYRTPDLDRGRLLYTSTSDLIAEIPIEAGMDGEKLLGFVKLNSGDVLVLTNETGTPQGSTGKVLRIEAIPNNAPVAEVAESNITVNEGELVTLSASGSSDPDGDTLLYVWTQTSGATVTLNNGNTATATFTAPNVEQQALLEFMVEVSDGHLAQSREVSVTVNNISSTNSNTTTGSDSGGGGGSMSVLLLLLLVCLIYSYSKRYRDYD
ncbi:PQQ-dependent sugar dehydrogenase [Pseudoalteromonas sp. Of7M-16]|uniref:PQQ-dependent sugar dehydrogenase n=1 Tax=Pseudoalteromonas sp. Of7M-16 TaxID=2917756 RepID=UPI001EF51739|nr:PQQ-dependent sugar dehydrogenase [Pseudoalteromonas sp. Of7M-16]MCG7550127.1 PQQ-dependent sugar dehydrogenase [Pseudoalteromonas sp. Of7M-16]